MDSLRFQSGDRVLIVSGTFATMPATVLSAAEIAARWPDTPPDEGVARGEAFWVALRMWGREVPVVQSAEQLAPHSGV